MFGKLSVVATYIKSLEVYPINRFPSKKSPIIAMVTMYLIGAYWINAWVLNAKTRKLEYLNGDGKYQRSGPWAGWRGADRGRFRKGQEYSYDQF